MGMLLRRHRRQDNLTTAADLVPKEAPEAPQAPEAPAQDSQDSQEAPEAPAANQESLVDADGDGDVGLVCNECDPPRDFKTKAALGSHKRSHQS